MRLSRIDGGWAREEKQAAGRREREYVWGWDCGRGEVTVQGVAGKSVELLVGFSMRFAAKSLLWDLLARVQQTFFYIFIFFLASKN